MNNKRKGSHLEDVPTMASEPVAACHTPMADISRTGEFYIPSELDPGIGPYSMSEIDQQLEEADKTLRDASQWSTLSDIIADFKQEHAAWFR